jgi:hypothetical protein
MNRILKILLVFFIFLQRLIPYAAVTAETHYFQALGAPSERKVDVSWNRYHDCEGLANILKQLNTAFPDLIRLYSIGKSYEEREIWCLEVTNRECGDPQRKAGMYIDGNIHGNEVQAGEVVAYTAWYLCESYGKVETITKLLDERVFYLLPTINPDGRDYWFYSPNTPHSSRSGKKPVDNDRDGLFDEDGTDDLDGDGVIATMRKLDPNGRWKPHPDHPEYLMIRAKPDEKGMYSILGSEGIDNDGDGEINEDGPGGYDSNRNWAFDWQPNYVQYGAQEYPFCLPNTRAVAEFVLSHPNIAAAQSYHNAGGMILRSPGREGGEMAREDNEILQTIAARGERILPFYRSMRVWPDLYTVWGGEIDWFYGGRGILTFTNELWSGKNLYRADDADEAAQLEFDRYVLQSQAAVKWREYDHPTYGKIEIGGWRKEFGRVPPSFLLEEECHRNMAFTLYHAQAMPLLSFGEITMEKIGDNVSKIWIEIKNDGMIPTRTRQDANHNISLPDFVSFEGNEIHVLSSGRVTDPYFKQVEAVKVRPHQLKIDSIPGLNSIRVQFIAIGKGPAIVTVDSVKGGLHKKEIRLE